MCSSYGRQSGVQQSLMHLQQFLFWSSRSKHVGDYIRRCLDCKPSLLVGHFPFAVPSRPFESIFIDFISILPTTQWKQGYTFIVVWIFSKMKVFIPCSKSIDAPKAMELFCQHGWSHFGLLLTIIPDHDSQFVSHFGRHCGIF